MTQTASDGVAQILKLWGMWSAPSLTLLPGPLYLGEVVRIKYIGLKIIIG